MTLTIRKNKSFQSFRDFRKELRLYSKYTHQRFVTAKSQLNKDAQTKPKLPYKMKYYKCEKYASKQCKAYIRICMKGAGPNKDTYVITRLNLDHNHQCNQQVTDFSISSTSSDSSSDQAFDRKTRRNKVYSRKIANTCVNTNTNTNTNTTTDTDTMAVMALSQSLTQDASFSINDQLFSNTMLDDLNGEFDMNRLESLEASLLDNLFGEQ